MKEQNNLDLMKYIFGGLFVITQRWKNIGDRYLQNENLTTAQWLLLAILVKNFDNPPTLSQAAEAMGTSRQNVKQIALKLEKRGFLQLIADTSDNRILRLYMTKHSRLFWEQREEKDDLNVAVIFTGLTDDEIKIMYGIVRKLERQTVKMAGPKRLL